MQLACPTCGASFEIDDAEAALPGTPVCEDCQIRASRDSRVPPAPKPPGVRPRAPSLSRDDGGLGSLSIPDALPARTRSRRPPPPDEEGDPVSLRELDAVLSPGIAPPAWKDRVAAPKAPKKESFSFFQVDEPPSDDVPVDSDVPIDSDVPVDPDAPTSGLLDLRQLAASVATDEKSPKKSADLDIFNLSGGIFQHTSKPLDPIDLSLLVAPPPPSSRPDVTGSLAPVLDAAALTRSRSTPPPKASARSSAPPPTVAGASSKAEPTPSHRAANAAIAAAQRSVWTNRIVAIAAVVVAAVVVFAKVGRSDRAEGEAASASARVEAAPTQTSDPSPPTVAEPVKTATPPAADVKPTATAGPAKPPKEADGKRAEAPPDKPRPTAQVEAPPKAPPKETAVVAAPPAPPSGAEFDRGAAKNALAQAAAAAAGCKKPDDPSGAAKVQVTFSPSGRVTVAKVSGPPFQGTPTGSCIAAAFRGASVPPFDGSPVTVSKDVVLR